MKGAGSVGGIEAVYQQALSWHSGAGNDQSCSIWREWMGSQTEGVVFVLCMENDRKIGPGYVPRSFASNLPHHTSVPHTDTALFHLQVSSRAEWHRKNTACQCVCVTLCIYTEQQDVIITHIHKSLACLFIYLCSGSKFNFLPHLVNELWKFEIVIRPWIIVSCINFIKISVPMTMELFTCIFLHKLNLS